MNRFLLVLLFTASALAQSPTITRLDAFIAGASGPSGPTGPSGPGGPAITAGAPFAPNSFNLQITGTGFDNTFAVDWINGLNITTLFPSQFPITPTTITVSVPRNLYLVPASITISVHPVIGVAVGLAVGAAAGPAANSASSPFTVNPTFNQTAGTVPLPPGTVNAPYSQPIFTGGTPPYTIARDLEGGITPPGMPGYSPPVNNQANNLYTGTPTAAGNFSFFLNISDPWGANTSQSYSLLINSALVITNTPPPNGIVGVAYSANLTAVNGTPPYFWSATGLPPGLTLNSLTGAIGGTPTAAGTFPVTATVTDAAEASAVAQYSVVINPRLAITSQPLPNSIVGFGYFSILTAANGSPPYSWTASGLPPGLTLNSSTGTVTGTPTTAGTFSVTVQVIDSTLVTASAVYSVVILPPLPPPLRIGTFSPLPSGTVGVSYVFAFDATGGTGSYTWAAGPAPAGLAVSSAGIISGTPTTPGQSTFTVRVTDSSGQTAAKDFSMTILPALVITTVSPLPSVLVGSALSIKFAAIGGVPPYTFGATGSLPPGTGLASDGTLSGTAAATGTFAFRIVVTDSSRVAATGTASKDFTIAITPPPLSISTKSPLGDGQAGVAYSVQFGAAGGVPPYSWSIANAPAGMSFSASGLLNGTPAASGQFSLSVTVTDASGSKATGTLALTLIPAALVITTASLPNGTVGVAYSTSLAVSGGVPPYTWSAGGLPDGVSGAANGAISGTPGTAGQFTVTVTVKDSAAGAVNTSSKQFSVTIAPPLLVITTASVPNGVVGTAYSATFLASGGVPPYTWSATGLPPGLSLASNGALSGTPTAAGAPSFSVTARDSAGTAVSRAFPVTIALPAPPPLTFNGLGNSNPATQPRLQIAFGTAYPVDVTVVLNLAFQPDSGADDPAVQFSTGGRTARITVPAGSTTGQTDVGVQTGTVAGTISITAQLLAPGDITPSPAPNSTIRINATAPVISSITATRNATGFTVVMVGYASSRDLTQASFQFTAATGANLQTSSLTVPIDALFAPWYSSAASAPFGSQFTLTLPFTVQGSAQSIVSVTVTLTSKVGTSAAASANLQ